MKTETRKIAYAAGSNFDFSMPGSIQLALETAVQQYPDGKFVFMDSLESELSISYSAMWNRALNLLGNLQTLGCKIGEHVVLDASSPADFIPALWACLLGGMIAIPLAPSNWNKRSHREFSERLRNAYSKLNRPIAISHQKTLFQHSGCITYSYQQLIETCTAGQPVRCDATQPAVMISTSGTTGTPQLVVLSGHALMHRWWPAGPNNPNSNCFLNWMPFDHVMGLGFASPNCLTKISLNTERFIKNPSLWTSIIHQYQVTHAGMSNFGMKLINDHCASNQQQLMSARLTSLKKVGVGTEMISSKICSDFMQLLTLGGAAADAVILGYGLSECGPVAGGSTPFSPDSITDARLPPLIDIPTQGHSIRIVDENGQILTEQEIGQIQVCGPTMTSGYFKDDVANKLLFTEDLWLRTGDVGYLQNAHLCVTGRIKETISINAEKYSCIEMDALIENIPDIEVAHVFNFVESEQQHTKLGLVYVADIKAEEIEQLETIIRKTFSDTYGFGIHRCQKIAFSDIPRTRTGKLQRHLLPVLLKHHQLPSQSAASHETLQDKIAAIMSRFLDGNMPEAHQDFFTLGGDSLGALMLTAALERELNIDIPPAAFAQMPTVTGIMLHHTKSKNQTAPSRVELVLVQQGKADKTLFLTPSIWGNNTYASQLATEMGEMFSVWTFHLSDKTQKMQSISEFAEVCCQQLKLAQPQGPYHLAGHSFGGLIAYEMACQLTAAGNQVETLCIIDTVAKLEQRDLGIAKIQPPNSLVENHRHISKLYLPQISKLRVHYFKAKDSVYYCRSDQSAGWGYYAKAGVCTYDIPGDHQSIVKGTPRKQIAQTMADIIHGKTAPVITSSFTEQACQHINLALKSCIEGKLRVEIRHLMQAVKSLDVAPSWLWMRLAHALYDNHDIESATLAYVKAVKNDAYPLNSHYRFRRILSTITSGNIAKNVLTAISRIHVDSPATAYMIGQIFASQNDFSNAKKYYLAGLQLFPQSLELAYSMIEILIAEKNHAEAEQIIRQALEVEQENDVVFFKLAKLAARMYKFELADACLNKCIAIDPENSNAKAIMQKVKLARQNASMTAKQLKTKNLT